MLCLNSETDEQEKEEEAITLIGEYDDDDNMLLKNLRTPIKKKQKTKGKDYQKEGT